MLFSQPLLAEENISITIFICLSHNLHVPSVMRKNGRSVSLLVPRSDC